jgi:hypothetical protein
MTLKLVLKTLSLSEHILLHCLKKHDSLEYNDVSDTVIDLAGLVQEWKRNAHAKSL